MFFSRFTRATLFMELDAIARGMFRCMISARTIGSKRERLVQRENDVCDQVDRMSGQSITSRNY